MKTIQPLVLLAACVGCSATTTRTPVEYVDDTEWEAAPHVRSLEETLAARTRDVTAMPASPMKLTLHRGIRGARSFRAR
jgi:hypothetical protein